MNIEESKTFIKSLIISYKHFNADGVNDLAITALENLLNHTCQLEEQNVKLKKKKILSQIPGGKDV